MLRLLPASLILCAAAPALAENVEAPAGTPRLSIKGDDAPGELGQLRAGRPTVLTVQGPGVLTLHLFGIAKAGKAKPGVPLRAGSVVVRAPAHPSETINLDGESAPFTIDKHPQWRLTKENIVQIKLEAGPQSVFLIPKPQAKLGFALKAELTRAADAGSTAAGSEAQAQAATPAPGSGSGESASTATAATEPPLAGSSAGGAGDAAAGAEAEPELPLLAQPGAAFPEPALRGQPGVIIVGTPPPAISIAGPTGVETFVHASIDGGIQLEATGPGTLVVDFHAHRSQTQPETQKPVVVGLLIDDVLVQTLSLNQPASSDYRLTAEGAPFQLSKRMTLRVPIVAGAHRVTMSLSDSAQLGVSAKVRFESADALPDPTLLNPDAARSNDLVARSAAGNDLNSRGLVLSAAAGAWRPSWASQPGLAMQLGAELGLPLATRRLALAFMAGFTRGTSELSATPALWSPARSGIDNTVSVLTQSLPLSLELSFLAPLPAPWVLMVGAGGGVAFGFTRVSAFETSVSSGLTIAAMATGSLTFGLPLGPGVAMLRAQASATRPVTAGPVRSFDMGGAALLLGYRMSVGP